MNATEGMADFIVNAGLDDVPEVAIVSAKRAILDTIGVMLAGASEPVAGIVTGFVREMGGAPHGTVVGSSLRTSTPLAALANGTLGHALDFDDSNYLLNGHPSVGVLPAVLAQGERQGASGREVLEAFVVGYEISTKLGAGMNPAHYNSGWHSTCTLGAMGAAAAAAHLRRLDAGKTRFALGCAASHASGLHANFGTMTKPLHAGLAPEAGVRAAGLAAAGLTSNPGILEAPGGFCQVFCGEGNFRLGDIVGGLGQPYSLETPGLNIKPYPCCMSTHAAVDALLDIMEEAGIEAEDVDRIDVALVEIAAKVLRYHRPRTGLEGKFSIEYCLARALKERTLRLGAFADESVGEPGVRDLMERICVRADNMDWKPGGRKPAEVTVHTRDGRTLHKRRNRSRGSAAWPLTQEEVQAKFRDCAARRLNPEKLEEAMEKVGCLEKVPDIRPLMALLA
ncbi:MAG: hypothetical protein A3J27_08485 [Candidatus Tectomicrobia bacterium RIFCSPLOWO2_12_FULL_69_37]|nr:MAG: hypothetical protein A3J27_08485 [Candidatus Tectomicrobia bacterium RIFCSPLOWO2_12_FULL_69_37]